MVDMVDIHEVMIDTEILFLKLTRTSGMNVGINLFDGSDSFDPQVNVNGTRSRVANIWSTMDIGLTWTLQMVPRINILLNNGDASILARPHIITKSGEAGSFQSGGTMYYKVASAMAADLKSVDYGMIIALEPHFRSKDEIVSTVSMEMSIPTTSSSSADLSLDKYQMANTVSCRLGQSIILSGFLENIRNALKSKTPILGDIPLLNLFFSNRTKSDANTEVIAIITPRVLMPGDDTPPDEYFEAGSPATNLIESMSASVPYDAKPASTNMSSRSKRCCNGPPSFRR